jgi:hypothetical protein
VITGTVHLQRAARDCGACGNIEAGENKEKN